MSRDADTLSWPSPEQRAGSTRRSKPPSRHKPQERSRRPFGQRRDFRIRQLLTDNDKAFTDRLRSKQHAPSSKPVFDKFCAEASIDHRLQHAQYTGKYAAGCSAAPPQDAAWHFLQPKLERQWSYLAHQSKFMVLCRKNSCAAAAILCASDPCQLNTSSLLPHTGISFSPRWRKCAE